MNKEKSPNTTRLRELEKECAYLRRKIARMDEQRERQEKIDDINRHFLKQSNERLLQFHEKAQFENVSKSDFLANMSHEIRTPLNIILGMANLLAETELSTTQAQYLSSLRITGRQLMEILNNILEFSRIEAGKITFEPEPFSLLKIIGQIEASALPLCMQKNLDFVVSHDPLLIMERKGDPLKLFQILLNLINNAVKFTKNGTITLLIEEDYTEQGCLVFNVIDTGIGISKEQQDVIFDRFTQANESLAQQHSGAGLGLAISKKLIEAMGGNMKVNSVPGEGSTFRCRFPIPPLAPSERRQLRYDASLILPDQFPQLSILAVDDIKENLDVIKIYLKDYPVSITTAQNGLEALQHFQDGEFDIILMDVRMPIMDGITATKTIRKEEKRTGTPPQIIMAVTAHAFQEQKNKFLEVGFDGVLTKPFFRRELIQTLFKFTVTDDGYPSSPPQGNKAIGYCLEYGRVENIPEELRDLLPQLLETIDTDLKRLHSNFTNKDYSNLYADAHSLKGIAGMFGFQQLASLINDLSQSVKGNNHTIATELLDSLDVYLQRLQNQGN